MTTRPPFRHGAVGLGLLLAGVALGGLAGADPAVVDNANGTKTVVWDLNTPGDYSLTNVSFASGNATLDSDSRQWVHTSDADFAANGTWDANVTVGGDAVALAGNPGPLNADGSFDLAASWNYSVSGRGAAGWNATAWHADLGGPLGSVGAQYDSMDDCCSLPLPNWTGTSSVFATSLLQPSASALEGAASLQDDINVLPGGTWAGASRSPGPWDWSLYDRIGFWLSNVTVSGPGLYAYLHLEDQASQVWDSPNQPVGPGWAFYEFDVTAFPGNLAAVDRVDVRFGGIIGSATLLVDDIRLWSDAQTIGVSTVHQDVPKSYSTTSAPGSAVLAFDYALNFGVNVGGDLNASWDGTTVWSQPLAPSSGSVALDVSAAAVASGTFTLSFSLRIVGQGPYDVTATAAVDNVSFAAPNHRNGTFVSSALNATPGATWGTVAWSSIEPPGTSVQLFTRSGWREPVDATWSLWVPAANGAPIASPPGAYLQYRADLNTTNASRTSSLSDITLAYAQVRPSGLVETTDFVPAEPLLGWRWFNATSDAPPGTSVQYAVSTDGGLTWASVGPGNNLSLLAGGSIRVRALLLTNNGTLTPTLDGFEVTYEFEGPLDHLGLTPPDATIAPLVETTFTATGFDLFDHPVAVSSFAWTVSNVSVSSFTNDTVTVRAGGAPITGWVRAESGGLNVTASVRVTSAGIPVVAGTLTNIDQAEDSDWYFLDLSAYAAGQPDPADTLLNLRWYVVVSRNDLVTVDGLGGFNGHLMILKPSTDAVGATHIELWLEDRDGLRSLTSLSFWFTLMPVNDPPSLLPLDIAFVRYDEPRAYDLDPYVDDADNATADLAVTAGSSYVTVSGLQLTLLFPQSLSGQVVSVPLTVSDGLATTPATLIVSVGATAPRNIPALPPVSFPEDTSLAAALDLDTVFAGQFSGTPSYVAESDTIQVLIDAYGVVSLTPPANWYGTDVAILRASDGATTLEKALVITVTPVNDAPRLTAIPPVTVVAGGLPTTILLYDYVEDVDDPWNSLTFNLSDARVRVVGTALVFEYPRGAAADPVSLTVSDGNATVSMTIEVRLTYPPLTLIEALFLPWSALLALALLVAGLVLYRRFSMLEYTIEDLFLITLSGKLLLHTTRRMVADRDEDILAAMLTAVQSFVADSFGGGPGDLRSFQHGEKTVYIARGQHTYLAVIYAGEPPEGAQASMAAFLADVEEQYGSILPRWTGDMDAVVGLKEMADAFATERSYKRGLWRRRNGRAD